MILKPRAGLCAASARGDADEVKPRSAASLLLSVSWRNIDVSWRINLPRMRTTLFSIGTRSKLSDRFRVC